jgi:hypothetical protein
VGGCQSWKSPIPENPIRARIIDTPVEDLMNWNDDGVDSIFTVELLEPFELPDDCLKAVYGFSVRYPTYAIEDTREITVLAHD